MELNKKVKIFGKQIPAVLLALVAMTALASAGLLSYYGKAVGTATVSQSVKLSATDGINTVTAEGDGAAIPFDINVFAGDPFKNGLADLDNDGDKDDQITYFELSNDASASANVKIPIISKDIDGDGKEELLNVDLVTYENGACTTTSLDSEITDGTYDVIVPAKGKGTVQFCVVGTFKLNTKPGTYQNAITIQVNTV